MMRIISQIAAGTDGEVLALGWFPDELVREEETPASRLIVQLGNRHRRRRPRGWDAAPVADALTICRFAGEAEQPLMK